MNPILPPPLIDKGILIYFPPSSFNEAEGPGELITSIYFSQTNPKFNWLSCNPKQQILTRLTTQYSLNGVVVIYRRTQDLPIGFYTIESSIVLRNRNRKGSQIIGIVEETPYLIIGMPYSSYAPLLLA